MRRGRLISLCAFALTVLVGGPFAAGAWGADVREGAFEIGGFGGYYIMEGNQWLSDAPVFGGRLGYFITRDLSIEFSASHVPTSYNIDAGKGGDYARFNRFNGKYVDFSQFRFEFLYHFPVAADMFIPFVGLGSGLVLLDSNAINSKVDTEVSAGLGMKVSLTDDLFFRMDARYILLLDNWIRMTTDAGGAEAFSNGRRWNNLETVFGLSYLLGGKVKDSDGDGVPDDKDACPDTPRGAIVDSKGCPLDSDGDYVFDGIDECPGTPLGAWVDSRGCPRDSDGDGVLDGIDQCPDTPLGTPVDEFGCPLKQPVGDADGDGVLDDVDECPGTVPGAIVDAKGCNLGRNKIFFKFNSAELDSTSQGALNEVVGILKARMTPTLKVRIEGHTDSKGRAAYNQKLSVQRAESVKKYLVAQGIPAAALFTEGQGAAKPIASNATDEGRAMNRRIEFWTISK